MMKRLTILLMAFCLIGLVFLNGCKSEEEIVYDIRGTWTVNYFWSGTSAPPPGTTTLTFTGSLTSGTWTSTGGYNGTYTVNGMAVQWIYTSGTTYSGNFTTLTTMSGTMFSYTGLNGTWTANKVM